MNPNRKTRKRQARAWARLLRAGPAGARHWRTVIRPLTVQLEAAWCPARLRQLQAACAASPIPREVQRKLLGWLALYV